MSPSKLFLLSSSAAGFSVYIVFQTVLMRVCRMNGGSSVVWQIEDTDFILYCLMYQFVMLIFYIDCVLVSNM